MKKALMAFVVALAIMGLTGCESCSRMAKSIDSDLGGGLAQNKYLIEITQ